MRSSRRWDHRLDEIRSPAMSRWLRVGFLAAGVIILLIVVSRVDRALVGDAVRRARPRDLLAAIGFAAMNVLVKGVRWQRMAHRLSGRTLPLGAAVSAVLAGVAAASITPGRTLDLAKPALLRRRFGISLASGTAAALVERLFDGLSLLALFGFSLLALPLARDARFQPVLAAAGVLLAASALALAAPRGLSAVFRLGIRTLAWAPRLQAMVRRGGEAFVAGITTWREPRMLWSLVALSVAAAALEASRLSAVAASVGTPLSYAGAMLVFSAANLIAIAALVPGGVGVVELSMAAATALVLGTSPGDPTVAAVVLLDRLLSYYLVVGIGAVVLMTSARGEEVLRGA